MGVVSHLPLTHSNHSMLRTLLALGVFLIPQVSSLGYWPYGGYGLHHYGGHGLHPYVLVGDSDLVIQPFMVGWVTLSEWLACMVDFLVGMDMGVMATVKSMAGMVEEKVMVAAMAAMVVEKDMARAAKTTATRDMATVGTDVPSEVLRPTTHPLLLLITLLTPINQCLVWCSSSLPAICALPACPIQSCTSVLCWSILHTQTTLRRDALWPTAVSRKILCSPTCEV